MSVNAVTGYSAGILLHRIALSVPRRLALSGDSEELTYAQLASRALAWLDLFEQSDPATQAVSCSAQAPLDQVACIWGALLSAFPASLPGDGAALVPRPPYPTPRRMLMPQPGEAPALMIVLPDRTAVLWNQKALALAWAIFSPPPGSVGVIQRPLSGPSSWPTSFGVLIGRGRALIKPFAAERAWLEALTRGGVTDVHFTPDEAKKLGALGKGSGPSVRRVFVWSPAAVELALLRSLSERFPSASVSRILQFPVGPITIATLGELSKRGAQWCGRPILGAELTLERIGASAVLSGRSVCAGRIVSPGAPGSIQDQVPPAVRWPVRVNSESDIFFEKENGYA